MFWYAPHTLLIWTHSQAWQNILHIRFLCVATEPRVFPNSKQSCENVWNYCTWCKCLTIVLRDCHYITLFSLINKHYFLLYIDPIKYYYIFFTKRLPNSHCVPLSTVEFWHIFLLSSDFAHYYAAAQKIFLIFHRRIKIFFQRRADRSLLMTLETFSRESILFESHRVDIRCSIR